MDIVAMALHLAAAVEAFAARAKRFFYDVVLSDHVCPNCGGRLIMVGESRCRCAACSHTFDPTIAFQRCTSCGGEPVLRVRRYCCRACGRDVASRFVFDGLVFDAEYFRRKMAELRKRKQDHRERVRQMLAECRSAHTEPGAADLGAMPGLTEALNTMVNAGTDEFTREVRPIFDLRRYRKHLQEHIGPVELAFDEIPALGGDRRQDRIWRFVALIFMTQTGVIDIWQEGQTIMVVQHEAH